MATDTFTTGSGNWTVPANVTSVLVKGDGGGGGGGGAGSAGAGGGGGGAHVEKTLSVSPGDTIAYIVGGGGAHGTGDFSFPTNGSDGGDSTATYAAVTYTAGGGLFGHEGANSGAGGAGGTATNGDVNTPGGAGGNSNLMNGGSGGIPNGGGGGSVPGDGSDGTGGQVSFTYTPSTPGEEVMFESRSCIAGGSCAVP